MGPGENQLLNMLADELDAARAQLETLGVALIGDPLFALRHVMDLQALDHVGQRCACIAAILRADDRFAAGHAASLEAIPARLRAGS